MSASPDSSSFARALAAAALAALLCAAAACGRPDESESTKKQPLTLTHDDGLVTFDPALLTVRGDGKTLSIVLPPMRILLDDERPWELAVQLAVECARQAVFEQLQEDAEFLLDPIEQAFSVRSAQDISTKAGQMEAKRDIIRGMHLVMKKRGIAPAVRDVLFLQFHIRRVR